jgi:hypothetical protein
MRAGGGGFAVRDEQTCGGSPIRPTGGEDGALQHERSLVVAAARGAGGVIGFGAADGAGVLSDVGAVFLDELGQLSDDVGMIVGEVAGLGDVGREVVKLRGGLGGFDGEQEFPVVLAHRGKVAADAGEVEVKRTTGMSQSAVRTARGLRSV